MSREKMDVIQELVVKHFLIKNEVTSTLVLDYLFCGLKSLEEERSRIERLAKIIVKELVISNQVESTLKTLEDLAKNKQTIDDKEFALKTLEDETKNERTIEAIKFPAPIANVDKDMFIVNDPMSLLERFVLAPLPEMGSPNLVQVSFTSHIYMAPRLVY